MLHPSSCQALCPQWAPLTHRCVPSRARTQRGVPLAHVCACVQAVRLTCARVCKSRAPPVTAPFSSWLLLGILVACFFTHHLNLRLQVPEMTFPLPKIPLFLIYNGFSSTFQICKSPSSAHSHRRCSSWLLLLEAVAQIWTGCSHSLQLSPILGPPLTIIPSPLLWWFPYFPRSWFFIFLLNYALILVSISFNCFMRKGLLAGSFESVDVWKYEGPNRSRRDWQRGGKNTQNY